MSYSDKISVTIYLFSPDFLWTSTVCIACSEDSPLEGVSTLHKFLVNNFDTNPITYD